MTTDQRWSRRGYARQYDWAQCRYCGRAQAHDCPRVECRLCGSAQCFGNGSSNGHCSVCHHGLLTGWGGESKYCDYKGCDGQSVATARKLAVCIAHAQRVKVTKNQTLAEYVASRIAHRDSGKGWQYWQLVT